MTQRLYYTDSYAREFQGTVIETTAAGHRPAVVLDRSLFYPTSGGHPHDTGGLGSAAVVDVIARDRAQTVLHLLDAPVDPGPVTGSIDWTRRYDHMHQHTGQHILSQAFLQTAGAETVGFHLGAETVTIDLATAALAEECIADTEALANRIVAANLAIRAWFPTDAELRGLTLRKEPQVAGPVRLVAIGDFDLSPCGGTHLAGSGEVGLIAVQRAERKKGGTRLEFLCGERARADYARKRAIVRDLYAHEQAARLLEGGGSPVQVGIFNNFAWRYRGPEINSFSAPPDQLLSSPEALRRLFEWFDSVGGVTNREFLSVITSPAFVGDFDGSLRSPAAAQTPSRYPDHA